MSRMLWNAILILLATVALAACGSPATTTNGGGGSAHLVTVRVELLADLVPNLDEAGLVFTVNGVKGDDPNALKLTYAEALATPPQFDTAAKYKGSPFSWVKVDLDFPTYYPSGVSFKIAVLQSVDEVVAKFPIARDLNATWSCTQEDYENGKLVNTEQYSEKLHLEPPTSDGYYTTGIHSSVFKLLGNKIFGDYQYDSVSGQVDDSGTKFQFTDSGSLTIKVVCNR